ncbi:hypothetical protein AA0117_g13209 [Alternaria alternata]|uniref:Uncharacterized protein n=1 Tax=Alternaria alternata TaxID=5599 RepID=A0A4Q4MTR8_ALTAL|nr:hypothetical protein AA0117_g13209 [Alternaria alternata]
MAPFGVPPTAKDKQRVHALYGPPTARHSLPEKTAISGGSEVGSTPEVAPAPELEPDDSEWQEEGEMPIGFSFLEDDGDDDCEPKTKAKKKAKLSKALVRARFQRRARGL